MSGAYTLYVNLMANTGGLTSGLRGAAGQLRTFDSGLAGVGTRLGSVRTATEALTRAQAAASAEAIRSQARVTQAAERAAAAQQVVTRAHRAQALAASLATRAQEAHTAATIAGERAARAQALAQTMASRAQATAGAGAAAAARTAAAAQVAADRAAQGGGVHPLIFAGNLVLQGMSGLVGPDGANRGFGGLMAATRAVGTDYEGRKRSHDDDGPADRSDGVGPAARPPQGRAPCPAPGEPVLTGVPAGPVRRHTRARAR
ncbi:hypothetical protein Snoj_32680 [Streptomyces nojiriensis]|uniref:Uncharacterized protein n=1 Tax=Streptomyces nojiriensis TaxID=66374 RepID=A0ABQ3SMI2_9ACTN|nr:hypothetical protein JYK04_00680 [Streptomyces nojiriensis]GGS33248.1 hypothetical protein GCM10010205_74330 [Streptomyces nojiriensis]GHI69350.1 hypothetical protein Snoj_32680 [Streptomyces nojiriensis]